jgi:transcription antitermination protein NusB
MLNRRTLRIKAMQSIFAYEQCKEANYHLAMEQIAEEFLPDLNSMEKQDKTLLKAEGNEAVALFKKYFKDGAKKVTEGSSDKINNSVNKAIANYYRQQEEDSIFLKKEMLRDAEQIYDRFGWLLYWLESLVKILSSRKPKSGSPSYNNILGNRIIKLILDHGKLSSVYAKSGLTWEGQDGESLVWVNEVLLKDETVVDYLGRESTSFDEDKEFILHLYKALIFKSEIIGLYMEQNDLYWSENKAILRSMVLKTIKGITDGKADFELAELSYNWEEDKQFFETIFDKTVHNGPKYEELIAGKSKNWDLERISDTDRILLLMAIQEMINFPGIPLKVTINEYIEVSKKYSTPKSKQFINGVLDVIAVDLQEKGEIKKSGRGLIDNK